MPARPRGGGTAEAVAALDCGTNSTRLLVSSADGDDVVRLMRVTRLGQGVDATRQLDPAAVCRTLDVLADYRAVMDRSGAVSARLVATSAVRDARNGKDFLEAASEVVRVRAEVLSGTEEGRLSYIGATLDLPPVDGEDVVVDIGGGSTELVVRTATGLHAVSLDLGCVRLTERYLRHDPPAHEELRRAVIAIREGLDRAVAAVPGLERLAPGSRLVGLAGTVSTLAGLEQGLAAYDRDRIHHFPLAGEAVRRWCDILAGEPAAARARRAGMVEGREDVLLGGALVLREVMRRLGISECLVSESDILDGIVAGLRGATAAA
ncbi:MAG: Ppx/GppA phosphatase family protein [Acidimicrobiales bacterium]